MHQNGPGSEDRKEQGVAPQVRKGGSLLLVSSLHPSRLDSVLVLGASGKPRSSGKNVNSKTGWTVRSREEQILRRLGAGEGTGNTVDSGSLENSVIGEGTQNEPRAEIQGPDS